MNDMLGSASLKYSFDYSTDSTLKKYPQIPVNFNTKNYGYNDRTGLLNWNELCVLGFF